MMTLFMKRNIRYTLLLLVPLIFLGVKCERPETVGPEYLFAPEGFVVNSFSVGGSTADFANTPDSFYASFSHKVSWIITLTGLSSGATKQITGTSSTIDGSNPSWLWYGSHDGIYFFRRLENVEAKLSFLGGSDLEIRDTLQIASTKLFKDIPLMDFETTTISGYGDGGDYPNGFQTIVEGVPAGVAQDINKVLPRCVQGTKGYFWYTKDLNNGYFGGGGAITLTPAQRAMLPSDPDSLYLNVYVYGEGNPAAKMNFGAREDDDLSGSHNPSNEDEFQVQLSLDHVGWKLFSIKYSTLTASVSLTNGGSGKKILEPKKITEISFALISSPSGQYVEAIIDFPILTLGAPFSPAK